MERATLYLAIFAMTLLSEAHAENREADASCSPRRSAKFPPVSELPTVEALPDPLVMFDGTPVSTPKQWNEQRREELRQLFQHYMYGHIPSPPGIEAKVTKTADVLEGKAQLKEVTIQLKHLKGKDAPRIHLAVIAPKNAKQPAPAFLALNKCGNHTVIADDAVSIHPDVWRHKNCSALEEARGEKADFWCVDYLIDRGYAFATYHESEIDPDQHDFTDGIHAHYDLDVPKDGQWGTIAAWAWGLHRCVDYLVADPDIAKDGICITGHSRRGKTALFAAALDDRVALVVPHQSGTGGMALSRNNDQETVERINRVFPHWFNDNFAKFNDNESQLPFDQHCLVALMAPRPLLDTAGKQDTWANYESSYRNIQAADRVYKFLGAKGMQGDGLVEGDEPINGADFGDLMQLRLDTKHTLNRDYWERILDFADAHLKK